MINYLQVPQNSTLYALSFRYNKLTLLNSYQVNKKCSNLYYVCYVDRLAKSHRPGKKNSRSNDYLMILLTISKNDRLPFCLAVTSFFLLLC